MVADWKGENTPKNGASAPEDYIVEGLGFRVYIARV